MALQLVDSVTHLEGRGGQQPDRRNRIGLRRRQDRPLGHDRRRGQERTEIVDGPQTSSTLRPAWFFSTVGAVTAEPAVADDTAM